MKNAAENSLPALGGPNDRRGFMKHCGAVLVAGAAAGGMATGAVAKVPGAKLSTYKGKYAIDSHRVVDGFFASPRGRTRLDIVVVIPASGTLDAAAEETARSYAARGWLAIAPNLTATYKGAALGGKSAMVAALMGDLPRLKRFARGNGTVAVIAA
jgi:carboxymethylenebutenolidase